MGQNTRLVLGRKCSESRERRPDILDLNLKSPGSVID